MQNWLNLTVCAVIVAISSSEHAFGSSATDTDAPGSPATPYSQPSQPHLESSLTSSVTAAGWHKKRARQHHGLLLVHVVVAALAVTVAIVGCFRAISSRKASSAESRRLAEGGAGGCGVSASHGGSLNIGTIGPSVLSPLSHEKLWLQSAFADAAFGATRVGCCWLLYLQR